jgi:hypothetical protein
MRTYLHLCHEQGASLADLLDAVDAILGRFVVFTVPAQRTLVTLWVAHTWALDAFDVTPYLQVRSPEPESGKTRLLEVLKLLTPKPWHAIQPSEAVLYRKIDRVEPTLLLDETDTQLGNAKDPAAQRLRGMLDAGNRRGATVPRCLKDSGDVEELKVFCPKAFAGIGSLPHTIASRSIPVDLRKRKPTEPVERFRPRDVEPQVAWLVEAFDRWASRRTITLLREARPPMPEILSDRTEEALEPLVTIADRAGGEWPARARTDAAAICAGRLEDASAGSSSSVPSVRSSTPRGGRPTPLATFSLGSSSATGSSGLAGGATTSIVLGTGRRHARHRPPSHAS